MRLPNSYGSVYKLSGKRRNPWVARKTIDWKIGKNGEAQPVYRYIGYYPTRSDALNALAEYNNNPADVPKSITLGELHENWSERHFKKLSDKTIATMETAWKNLLPYAHKDLSYFTLAVWQRIFDLSGKNAPMLKLIKTMLSQMYDYAEQYDLISPNQNKIKFIDIGNHNPKGRERAIFTPEEISILWEHSEERSVQYILMLIYTGLRVGELCALTPEDVHLEERWIDVKQSKTLAGVRQVPIAEKVAPFFTGEKYICLSPTGVKYSSTNMNNTIRRTCERLGFSHSSHEARHTCISMLTEKKVDPRIIKQIVGHSGAGVTEQVYTHISLEEKLKAINMI